MPPHRRRRLLALVVLTVLTAATAACSSSAGETRSPAATAAPSTGFTLVVPPATTDGTTDGTGPGTTRRPGHFPVEPVEPPTTTIPRSARHEATTTTAPAAATWAPCPEPAGRVVRDEVTSTVIAEQPVQRLLVYEPPCYGRDADRRYPVLYLFHGANTDETQWADVGIAAAADRLIASGQIPPLVIVLPDIIWGMGTYTGDPPLFDRVLLDEVVPHVEARWRTVEDRAHRAVGGISRGGEWALLVAGRHPEEFGAAGGHSPAVGPPSTPNPVLVPLVAAARPRVWLDVGEQDGLLGSVASFSAALTAAGLPNEYRPAPGPHDRPYWASRLDDYLRFYSAGWSTPSGGTP